MDTVLEKTFSLSPPLGLAQSQSCQRQVPSDRYT